MHQVLVTPHVDDIVLSFYGHCFFKLVSLSIVSYRLEFSTHQHIYVIIIGWWSPNLA